ncbi:hypothetical protein [Azohydromonas aeria]|uniref:hypothetical protein n=1 Tax=Azohydromonas aeria TaxID=2590212 RepID=UPI0018DFB0FD|nr:hypothetical protein [Azohydromonas aeria]
MLFPLLALGFVVAAAWRWGHVRRMDPAAWTWALLALLFAVAAVAAALRAA